MSQNNNLPLQELSINELFFGESRTYEIPIYQRNYAWGTDEIETLVQDVYDSFKKQKENYYIGTLVTFRKDNNLFEVIDGQQRLTTIYLILKALNEKPKSKLTYKARTKSDKTLNALPDFKDIEEQDKDKGIVNGFKCALAAIEKVKEKDAFKEYFLNKVHIIHYQVPRDIDLNHYFEVMNSRGEQLEKHEIVKARLMGQLAKDNERMIFNKIWEACSRMSTYVQGNFSEVFNDKPDKFELKDFDSLKIENNKLRGSKSIEKILSEESLKTYKKEEEKSDTFQPIIDFPNFLLIVLKITRMLEENDLKPSVTLDDKELLHEFVEENFNADKVKTFAFNLLKARFFLDNYIVHHSNEEDSYGNNPWKLQVLTKKDKETTPENLCSDNKLQEKLVHLLSMFEVSYTAKQRKNYLFYCLYWLMKNDCGCDKDKYAEFIENLADRYFYGVYLDNGGSNIPLPGSFDEKILKGKDFSEVNISKSKTDFKEIYGDGSTISSGIPLFVFNYLDYKIWKLYAEHLRGNEYKEEHHKRKQFFERLGCSDFGLDIFQKFYFSRTRRSLEHYFPQANAGQPGQPTDEQINCFGNFAMIGAEANSSGSNWSPKAKLDRYLDPSGKINQISVASLKFMIMMQICKDNKDKPNKSGHEWEWEEIHEHQSKMLAILGLAEDNRKSETVSITRI